VAARETPTIMSRDIELALIDPDLAQPRKYFDPTALEELAQSMAANGLATPILVRPVGPRYTLVAGERRWRAAQQLGWTTIPADVRDLAPDEAHWLALAENIQRADLTPIEEARAFEARLAGGLTQEALGQRIGKTQSYVAQKLRLLRLPGALVHYIDHGALSEGHARQLMRFQAWCHGMTYECNPAALDPTPLGDEATDEIVVLGLTLITRPRAHPIGGLVERDPVRLALLREGCRHYAAEVNSAQGRPPLWTLYAWWFASASVHYRWSVAELRSVIETWHENFLVTALWCMVYPEFKPADAFGAKTCGGATRRTRATCASWGSNSRTACSTK
jgi:ParB/RepB/Spo0J family partition protein